MNNKKSKFLQILPLILIAASFMLVIGFSMYYKHVYDTGYEMEEDKTDDSGGKYNRNINVMLTRSDDWRQIATDKFKMTKQDFSIIDGSTATVPITAELARQFCGIEDQYLESYVDHNTTGPAYETIIEGKSSKQLIFVTEPSDEELEMAKEHNVELDVTPVALDGFVFITHKDNPVESLTVQQIQDIYTGKITNWKEVGGKNEKIIPYQREKNSGSQTAMENIVMQGIPMMEPAESFHMVTAMGDLINYVSAYHNSECSLGYTFYYYLNNLYKSEDVKTIKIEGISPENENLISKKYPFTSAYYAVFVKGKSKRAEEIRDYLLTDEGQDIIKLAGYCPVR